jgi:hypothetical protein
VQHSSEEIGILIITADKFGQEYCNRSENH